MPDRTIVVELVVERTEQQLVEMARAAVNRRNWIIGEAASEWTQRFAVGRGDQAFADMIEVSISTVNQCRRVWETFGITDTKLDQATRSHFAWRNWVEMLSWEDAEDCIDFAAKNDWSFHDLQSWRAAKNGTQDPRQRSGPNQSGGDPASESLTGATGTTDPVRDVGTNAAPVSFPQATEPNPAIVTPHDPPPVAAKPQATDTSAVDMRAFVKAVRSIAKTADAAQRVKTAKTLRKLANEIDPPKGSHAFVPPTLAEVAAYCSERGRGIDPESVIDWALANGWKLSNGNQMRDWRAVVRTFEKREQTTNGSIGGRNGRPTQNESIANLAAAAVGGSGPGSLMPDEATGNIQPGGVGLLDSDTRIV